MWKYKTGIEVVSILLLMVIVSISVLTMTRTCEILNNGQVEKVNCSEVKAFDINN